MYNNLFVPTMSLFTTATVTCCVRNTEREPELLNLTEIQHQNQRNTNSQFKHSAQIIMQSSIITKR